ncbi:DUF485 domain-containing protein [Aeribacillus pallidus]|uniref:DUF485 domain-containing protein n=1 Tax=Aeribacillus TaxID=1055323 RepID=UPI0007B49406|nr:MULTISPECIES: DUF485 domain-containing protein [Aeribacillus]KZM57747.1 hypothetical protein A3Q35_04305 [Aeribacillus pallidus]MED0649436.1 DUF485 domain-containing protein [Aeribacillus composti]MED4488598.1 DUF485 domain-containing protein [Aeribacillus pallidus]BBU39385.1 hypothetical protein APP_16770 [Aeribacillus pallidus]
METFGKEKEQGERVLDYEKIVATSKFQQLIQKKRNFIVPIIIVFLITYFLLPILTGYTSILEHKAIGWITWTWLYSLGLFVMVWVFATMYVKKAETFDQLAEEIIEENIK